MVNEQMRKRCQFSPLNDEQMSNKVGVEHQPVNNHGDRKSPKWGYGTPYKWPKWLINGGY